MNMCLFEVAMWLNAEVAISVRMGGGKIVSTGGGEDKNFRTRGLPIWGGGYFCWGGQYPITCHVIR